MLASSFLYSHLFSARSRPCIKLASYIVQGSKKVSFGSLGQVDFLAGQVTLKAALPKGLDKSSLTKLLTKTTKLEGAPGKQNARAASPKDKI